MGNLDWGGSRRRAGHSLGVSTAIAFVCMACAVGATDVPTINQGTNAVAERPQAAAGMRVYIDPETGEPTEPPPGFVPEDRGVQAPLPREIPNPGPAGGYILDTSGMSFDFEAKTAPGGKTTADCHSHAAPSARDDVKP